MSGSFDSAIASRSDAITPLQDDRMWCRQPLLLRATFPSADFMEQRLILINLLIKLGVAASAASILGRSVEFKSLLFRDERNWKQRIYLVLWIGIPLALGVWIRINVKSFLPGDLSFETT